MEMYLRCRESPPLEQLFATRPEFPACRRRRREESDRSRATRPALQGAKARGCQRLDRCVGLLRSRQKVYGKSFRGRQIFLVFAELEDEHFSVRMKRAAGRRLG